MLLLDTLQNKLDLQREPFSTRGSRLLVFKSPGKNELIVKLAERLTHIEAGLTTYLNHPPFIQELCFLDEEGSRLEFTLNSSPDVLTFSTRIGQFRLLFQSENELLIGLPGNTIAGVHFQVNSKYTRITEKGGEIKWFKNFGYQVMGEVVRNQIIPIPEGAAIDVTVKAGPDSSIAMKITDDYEVKPEAVPFSTAQKAARRKWEIWLNSVPEVEEKYREKYALAWYVLLNNIVSPKGMLIRETVMPAKSYYIGAWLWDCALHAIALRHFDQELACDQIRVMLDHQLLDGMLPDAVYDEGIVSEIDHPIHAKVTKPPILAWAAMKLFESNSSLSFINEIYPHLVKENTWWFNSDNCNPDGLVKYNHPYSSGMDDNPLFAQALPVVSPDINTYLCIQMQCLAKMADVLGYEDEAAMWRERAVMLVQRMTSELWDEKAGLFWAKHQGERIPVLTPISLFPLWTGLLNPRMVNKIINHLRLSNEFGGEFVIPTVARCDPAYQPDKMWSGPMWANVNYFLIEALQIAHEFTLAHALRKQTLDIIASSPGIFEYYNSETGLPPESAAPFFSWTAAVFIDLAIQYTNDEKLRSKGRKNHDNSALV